MHPENDFDDLIEMIRRNLNDEEEAPRRVTLHLERAEEEDDDVDTDNYLSRLGIEAPRAPRVPEIFRTIGGATYTLDFIASFLGLDVDEVEQEDIDEFIGMRESEEEEEREERMREEEEENEMYDEDEEIETQEVEVRRLETPRPRREERNVWSTSDTNPWSVG